jgi:RHS repeat-associated protein
MSHDPLTNWMLGDAISYDPNGNLTRLPNMSFEYDVRNRVVSINSLGGTEYYAYDHNNLRIWTRNAGNTETFSFYHGTKKLGTYSLSEDESGHLSFTPVKSNVYFGKRLIQSGGEVIVTDRLGSTRAWSAKGSAKKLDYTPFGQVVQQYGGEHANFAGYEEGFDGRTKYAEQRFYSSVVGRFMSPDPYDGSARQSDPNSWNRYAYVGNDPVNRVDPHGLWSSYSYGGGGGGGGSSWGSGGSSWGSGGSYGGGGGNSWYSGAGVGYSYSAGPGYADVETVSAGPGASEPAQQAQLSTILSQAQNIPVPPNTPAGMVPAVQIALYILGSDNAVSNYFSSNQDPGPYISAYDVLSSQVFATGNMGSTVGGSASEGTFGMYPININTQTFFNSGYAISGSGIATNSLLGQVETVLHEVGHEIGALVSDDLKVHPGVSTGNNVIINALMNTALPQLVP